jgi:hypothetical protein
MDDKKIDAIEQEAATSFANVRNFTEAFTKMLTDAGHPAPEAWINPAFSALHPDATDMTKEDGVRRFLMNRQLSTIMGNTTDEDNINKRLLLGGSGSLNNAAWLGILHRSIVPYFVEHNLPLR